MRGVCFLAVLFFLGALNSYAEKPIRAQVCENPKTFCNPVNLNYRFRFLEIPGNREAADPVVVQFRGEYYLFASKSSGYWYSKDLNRWDYVCITEDVLPIELFAPGIFIHNDYIYYVASTTGSAMLYRSKDPKAGKWEEVQEIMSYWDPAFLIEGDNLYLYYGCSPEEPIHARVLDLNTLEYRTEVIDCFNSNKERYGWERTGEYNEREGRPYIEGAWMTKHNNKYYLQYAGPGTEWSSYADGVYVSDSPVGPFTYMGNSPVSYKPTGFMRGAGHGCLFTVGNNYWKAATNSISVRHMFERRVSFYPAGFDKDGYLYTNTCFGDYPMYIPTVEAKSERPEWNLLSYNKPVKVSSTLEGFPAEQAVNEDSRTAWVATSAAPYEWFQVDLESACDITAIQVNFDEQGSVLGGRNVVSYQSYTIEASNDEVNWYCVVDNSSKKTDTPHDYIEFAKPFKARYLKIRNVDYTSAPYFSLRGFRVFGKGSGDAPKPVKNATAQRKTGDGCVANLSWEGIAGSDGYIVRYGIAPDKLYNNYQVMGGATSVSITSLNSDQTYYYTVQPYNANGVAAPATVYTIQ